MSDLTNGTCTECAGGGSEASRRRERLAALSESDAAAARASAEAWTPPDGFDLGAIEARDVNGDPLLIPSDRMAPPVKPRGRPKGKRPVAGFDADGLPLSIPSAERRAIVAARKGKA